MDRVRERPLRVDAATYPLESAPAALEDLRQGRFIGAAIPVPQGYSSVTAPEPRSAGVDGYGEPGAQRQCGYHGTMDSLSAEYPPALSVSWPGHATVSVQLDGVRLLTDPLLRDWLGPIRRRRGTVDRAAVAPVDAVLISHLHHDHLDLPSLRYLGSETPILVPPGGGRFLERRGFQRVQELPAGQSTRVGALTVSAIPAVHVGHRLFGPRATSTGYLVTGSRAVYFAGDTARFGGMRELAGAVDLALLPVGGWGPTLGLEGHMDWREASRALADIQPSAALPIHWGTFWPAGLEWLRPELFHFPGPRFAEEAARTAPGVDIHLLAPGQALDRRIGHLAP